jgi:aldehyde dehydrogenase (NAD+)
LQLILNPLIAAIAAGNAVVIKPSEVSAACAVLAETLMTKYMDNDAVRVVQGGIEESGKLLECTFDHIIYTGMRDMVQLYMHCLQRTGLAIL